MRKSAWWGAGVLAVASMVASAAAPDAKEIMVKQRSLLSVADETETLSMTIFAKNGDQKKRSVRRTTRTADGLSRTLVRFLSPRDVERTGVLTWENANGVDDQWMYLPAMKKVKRVASSGKKNRFMGTDFAYEDLRPEATEAHTYTVVRTEPCDKETCWVIEAVAATPALAEETGYSRRQLWVQQSNHMTVRVDFYDKANKLEKQQTNRHIKNVSGSVWRANEIEMRDVVEGTRTVNEVLDRTLNTGLKEELFSQVELEEGS